MDDLSGPKKATVACPFCGRMNRVNLSKAGDKGRKELQDTRILSW